MNFLSTPSVTRREFLAAGAVAAGGLALRAAGSLAVEPNAASRFPIIGFSKPFQHLTAEQTAELVAKVGWDGIECPVRAKGQIEPERVAEDLPRLVEVLRSQGLDVLLVATDITSMQTSHAEAVLRTMARLGIKRLRLGFFTYRSEGWPPDRLKEIAPALRDIAAACKELGLQAGFQNHSGRQYVGAPVWDVFSMIRDLDPAQMGFCFDIGHATIEGGLSWPVEARLAEPLLTAVLVKDFYWKKEPAGWREVWCPLGDGMVNRAFFEWLKRTTYRGPICQHHEYPLGDATETLARLRHDFEVLRTWLA
jgi:sugar phosphate isomerase/epimerase